MRTITKIEALMKITSSLSFFFAYLDMRSSTSFFLLSSLSSPTLLLLLLMLYSVSS